MYLTIIPGLINNLVIGLSIDDPDLPPHPVLFFAPSVRDRAAHYQIELSREQAAILHDWLDAYLRENQ